MTHLRHEKLTYGLRGLIFEVRKKLKQDGLRRFTIKGWFSSMELVLINLKTQELLCENAQIKSPCFFLSVSPD